MKMTLKIILYIRENSTFCLTSCKNYEIHFQSMLFFQKCEIFVKAAYVGENITQKNMRFSQIIW